MGQQAVEGLLEAGVYEELRAEAARKLPHMSVVRDEITDLMRRTRPNRLDWIRRERPHTNDIFRQFPRFGDMPDLVSSV